MTAPIVERVNVNLPRPLLEDLRKLVPRSRRSEVIARATARELRRLKMQALFEALASEPVWPVEDHPELTTGPAIDVFLARLRSYGVWALAAPETTGSEPVREPGTTKTTARKRRAAKAEPMSEEIVTAEVAAASGTGRKGRRG